LPNFFELVYKKNTRLEYYRIVRLRKKKKKEQKEKINIWYLQTLNFYQTLMFDFVLKS